MSRWIISGGGYNGNAVDLRGNAVLLTVRGEPVEPQPLIAEPFDKLRANG